MTENIVTPFDVHADGFLLTLVSFLRFCEKLAVGLIQFYISIIIICCIIFTKVKCTEFIKDRLQMQDFQRKDIPFLSLIIFPIIAAPK